MPHLHRHVCSEGHVAFQAVRALSRVQLGARRDSALCRLWTGDLIPTSFA